MLSANYTFKSSNGEAPRTDFDRAVLNSICYRPATARGGQYAPSSNLLQWYESPSIFNQQISSTTYSNSYARPDGINNFGIRQDQLTISGKSIGAYNTNVFPDTDIWETLRLSSYKPDIAAYLPERGEIVYFTGSNDGMPDSVLSSIRVCEFLVFNVRFGGKIVFNRYFAIQPYATVGFNVVQRKFSFLHGNYTTYNLPNGGVVKLLNDTSSTTKTKINIGLSTGAGIELLIYERLSIGAEYRHTVNQFKIFENSKTKLQTRHMIVKIGYYFL